MAKEAFKCDQVDWPGPRLVGLKQDEQRGLVVAMEELHVDDVQQLLVQLADVDDVGGQEAGLGPAWWISVSAGDATRSLPDATQQSVLWAAAVPFSNSDFLLISEGVLPEGQHHKLGAINEHDGAAILWVNPDDGDVHVLNKPILKRRKS